MRTIIWNYRWEKLNNISGRDKRAIGHSRSYKENDDKTNKNSKIYRKSKLKKLLELEKQVTFDKMITSK